MKLVFVAIPSAYNLDAARYFWGLGDLVRGICHLFERYAHDSTIQFEATFQFHPVGALLHQPGPSFPSNTLAPFILPHRVERWVRGTRRSGVQTAFICTNGPKSTWASPLSDACKTYVRSLLTPRVLLDPLPQPPFQIIHVRMGDGHFEGESGSRVHEVLLKLQSWCALHTTTMMTLLLSDSVSLKRAVANDALLSTRIHSCTDMPLAHSGQTQDHGALVHMLNDLQRLSSAQQIFAFSVYGGYSGFVEIARSVYDVPVYGV